MECGERGFGPWRDETQHGHSGIFRRRLWCERISSIHRVQPSSSGSQPARGGAEDICSVAEARRLEHALAARQGPVLGLLSSYHLVQPETGWKVWASFVALGVAAAGRFLDKGAGPNQKHGKLTASSGSPLRLGSPLRPRSKQAPTFPRTSSPFCCWSLFFGVSLQGVPFLFFWGPFSGSLFGVPFGVLIAA